MFLYEVVGLPSLVQLAGAEGKNAVVTRKEVM